VIFQLLVRETTVRGTMEAGKNSVIYMGLISGPNKADDTCGRTTVTGTMDRGFTVYNCTVIPHPMWELEGVTMACWAKLSCANFL
jgi:hypothetical protein